MMGKNKDCLEKILEDQDVNEVLENDHQELITTGEEAKELLKPGIQETEYLTDGLPPVEFDENLPSIEVSEDPDLDKDFQISREKIHSALAISSKAMKELSVVAKGSQHPRAYEVVALLAKTITDSSKTLMDLYQKQQEIKNPKEGKDGTIETQNNLFIGTVNELDKILEKIQKKKK